MIGETKERWQELCAQAAIEQDPRKLMTLIDEITRMLREKQARINHHSSQIQRGEASGRPTPE